MILGCSLHSVNDPTLFPRRIFFPGLALLSLPTKFFCDMETFCDWNLKHNKIILLYCIHSQNWNLNGILIYIHRQNQLNVGEYTNSIDPQEKLICQQYNFVISKQAEKEIHSSKNASSPLLLCKGLKPSDQKLKINSRVVTWGCGWAQDQ